MAKEFLHKEGLTKLVECIKAWAKGAFLGKDATITKSSGTNKGVSVSIQGSVSEPSVSVSVTTSGVSGNNSGIVSGSEVKAYVDENAATKNTFKAATSSSNAVNGLVPAPSSANATKFLRGDGAWTTPTIDDAIDSTSGSNGVSVKMSGTVGEPKLLTTVISSGVTSTSETVVLGKEVYNYALGKDSWSLGTGDKYPYGWFRIAATPLAYKTKINVRVMLSSYYNNSTSGAYTIDISGGYSGTPSVTMVSGFLGGLVIPKIRIVRSGADYYLDIYAGAATARNIVHYHVMGTLVPEEATHNPSIEGMEVFEFDLADGFKTNGKLEAQTICENGTALPDKYLPKSGGRMGVDATLTFGASKAIRQITALTHNAARLVEWYKGEEKDPNYEHTAQIGWYNIGDTDGAIFLVPHPTSHEPWSGSVGLYIGKNTIKWGNKPLIHSGNVGDYASLPGDAISAQSNNGGVKVQLGGTIGAPTISVTTTTGGVSAANSGVVSGKEVKDYVDANAATKSVFYAATSSSVGSNGLVPAPSSANTMKFLRGDGTWKTPTITKDSVTSALGYTPAKEVPNTMVWGGILNTAAYAADYAVGTVLKVTTSESLSILKDGSLITSSLASGTNVIVSHESYMSGSSYNSGKVFVIF